MFAAVRRLLALSSRPVAAGGESGPWRWLVPGLVVCVIAFAGQQIHAMNQRGDAALAYSLSAQDLSGDLAELGAAVAETSIVARRPALAPEDIMRTRLRTERRLGELMRQRPDDEQLVALSAQLRQLDPALDKMLARLRVRYVRSAAGIARRDVAPGLQRLVVLGRAVAGSYSLTATTLSARVRDRVMLLLGGGLALVCLLLWTFWSRRSAERLRAHEHRFRSLVQNSSDLIVVVDGAGLITEVTPVVERMLGRPASGLIGRPFTSIVHEDDAERVDDSCRTASCGEAPQLVVPWRASHAGGDWVDVESTCTNLLDDPAVKGLVLSIRDVRERKSFEAKLHHQAFHDSLTGLPNRALFEDRVGQAIARSQRSNDTMAVLFIDLDDFKTVNDSLGHGAGDELLILTAARLDESLRGMDTAARLGGDEFAVLVETVPGPDHVDALAGRLHGALERPFQLGDHEVFVRASIGVAISTGAEAADDLMRNADTAMYAAKSAGKGRHEVFRPTMHADARRRLQLTGDLRRAVRDNEFVVAYQPLVQLKDAQILGAEALVRWDHPTHGRVPPNDFIPLAEETGLIVPIGEFVLQEACRQAQSWQQADPDSAPAYVSVNLSPRQFRPTGKIVEDVRRATAESGLSPQRLMLEITESVFMEDHQSVARDLQALRDMGVRIAIDDFGTGYSTLSYLREFPIDIVKMDRSFVQKLGQARGDDALVRSVLEMGEALEMDIIAEGIEDHSQLDSLRALSCGIGQGFFFSRPLSPGEIADLVAGRTVRVED